MMQLVVEKRRLRHFGSVGSRSSMSCPCAGAVSPLPDSRIVADAVFAHSNVGMRGIADREGDMGVGGAAMMQQTDERKGGSKGIRSTEGTTVAAPQFEKNIIFALNHCLRANSTFLLRLSTYCIRKISITSTKSVSLYFPASAGVRHSVQLRPQFIIRNSILFFLEHTPDVYPNSLHCVR